MTSPRRALLLISEARADALQLSASLQNGVKVEGQLRCLLMIFGCFALRTVVQDKTQSRESCHGLP